MTFKNIIRLSFLLLLPGLCFGQNFSRIKADYSIKEKTPEGKQNLSVGKVYFDKFSGKIVYLNSFPIKETTLITDSLMYRIIENKIEQKQPVLSTTKFSIFSVVLNGQLANYGLEGSMYKITKVEKEMDMVISTWSPEGKYKNALGKILLSVKEKKLYGIVIFNKDDKIVSKQFYKKYVNVSGLDFPSEVVQIIYDKHNNESYQITSYKNIVINDLKEDNIYNFTLPRQ